MWTSLVLSYLVVCLTSATVWSVCRTRDKRRYLAHLHAVRAQRNATRRGYQALVEHFDL